MSQLSRLSTPGLSHCAGHSVASVHLSISLTVAHPQIPKGRDPGAVQGHLTGLSLLPSICSDETLSFQMARQVGVSSLFCCQANRLSVMAPPPCQSTPILRPAGSLEAQAWRRTLGLWPGTLWSPPTCWCRGRAHVQAASHIFQSDESRPRVTSLVLTSLVFWIFREVNLCPSLLP